MRIFITKASHVSLFRIMRRMKDLFGDTLVTDIGQGHDVSVISADTLPWGNLKDVPGPKIHRLDCPQVDPKYQEGNKNLRFVRYLCDHTIYQSQFSKKLCESLLGPTPGRYSVILNGWHLSEPHPEATNDAVFFCAPWRPTKRPKSSLTLAWRLADKGYPVYFLGMDGPSHSNIIYVYGQNFSTSCYDRGGVFVHLSMIDACPNTVVEALCAGLPVVTTDSGGQVELVEDAGVIIPEKDRQTPPFDLFHETPVDLDRVELMVEHVLRDRLEYRKKAFRRGKELRLSRTAESYREVLVNERRRYESQGYETTRRMETKRVGRGA